MCVFVELTSEKVYASMFCRGKSNVGGFLTIWNKKIR